MVEEKSLEFLGYPNYSVFSDGQVMNVITGRILGGESVKGYRIVRLCNKLSIKNFKVHRLVGLAFIPEIPGKTEIDHINRNKLDNRVENLRWASRYDQMKNTNIHNDNKLGHKHICKQGNLYRVRIERNHIIIFNEHFDTLEQAIQIRDNFLSATD